MLQELFAQKKQYLNSFFEKLNVKAAENFLNYLINCKGSLIFTGVGKSGLVAKKVAVTMTSTGSRALFLSPTNALHGDLGIVRNEDLFIIFSKSGESEELLNLIPYLRNKGVLVLGVVSHPGSRLEKACDFTILLPLERELCPYNMAPTTSTAIQMIFGDVMAIALMRNLKFSLDQYAGNHPGGLIGKKITLKVKDLMLMDGAIPLCKSHDKLNEALQELSNKRCGCILVVDDSRKLLGIFTDGDLRRALLKKNSQILEMKMETLMTPTARTIGPEALVWDALKMMEADQRNAITCMPVVDADKKVHGLIRLHDIVQSGLTLSSSPQTQ